MVTVGMNYMVREGREEVFEDKFAAVAQALAGADGHTRSQLFRGVHDSGEYLIVSEWNSLDAFKSFIKSDAFREVTAWGEAEILRERPRHKVYGE